MYSIPVGSAHSALCLSHSAGATHASCQQNVDAPPLRDLHAANNPSLPAGTDANAPADVLLPSPANATAQHAVLSAIPTLLGPVPHHHADGDDATADDEENVILSFLAGIEVEHYATDEAPTSTYLVEERRGNAPLLMSLTHDSNNKMTQNIARVAALESGELFPPMTALDSVTEACCKFATTADLLSTQNATDECLVPVPPEAYAYDVAIPRVPDVDAGLNSCESGESSSLMPMQLHADVEATHVQSVEEKPALTMVVTDPTHMVDADNVDDVVSKFMLLLHSIVLDAMIYVDRPLVILFQSPLKAVLCGIGRHTFVVEGLQGSVLSTSCKMTNSDLLAACFLEADVLNQTQEEQLIVVDVLIHCKLISASFFMLLESTHHENHSLDDGHWDGIRLEAFVVMLSTKIAVITGSLLATALHTKPASCLYMGVNDIRTNGQILSLPNSTLEGSPLGDEVAKDAIFLEVNNKAHDDCTADAQLRLLHESVPTAMHTIKDGTTENEVPAGCTFTATYDSLRKTQFPIPCCLP